MDNNLDIMIVILYTDILWIVLPNTFYVNAQP